MADAKVDDSFMSSGGSGSESEDDADDTIDRTMNGSVVQPTDRYGFMGGDQYTRHPYEDGTVSVEKLRKREMKWLDMFENWEKWMSKRFKKVKDRCRKGVPSAVRPRAWQYLCGAKYLLDQNKGKFEEYLRQRGDPKCIDDIEKDVHRQFPHHEMFFAKGGYGQEDLFRVLKAYAIHNPQDGYCQAQAPVAAALLMHMPAEQAFWCLVSICEKYLPGYYSPGLEAIQIDGDVLFGLLKRSSPTLYKHIKKQKIEPILCMTEWFMCLYTRTLPWSCVLRLLDMFFCEGVKVIFRTGLVLFKLVLGTSEALSECPTLYETIEKLRRIPHERIDEEFIVRESLRLNITDRDMEKEHLKQVARRRAAKDKPKSGKNKRKS